MDTEDGQGEPSTQSGLGLRVVALVRRGIVVALMVLMLSVVALSTVELAALIVLEVIDRETGNLLLDISELLGLFSFFFLVLIGLELLETIKMYVEANVVQIELVLLVALIAVARKVIVLDLNAYPPLAILALGGIILALGVAYALVRSTPSGKAASKRAD